MSKPSIAIRPYSTSDDEAIARLNQRFRAAGTTHVQYTGTLTEAVQVPGHRERLFVVADGDEIRGGAFLREVPVSIGPDEATIGWVKYPLAESQIDRAYSGVPAALLMQLLREQPRLAALGMGGHAGVFAQLLARLNWEGSTVQTFLSPLRPHVVAGALPHLKRSQRWSRLASILATSGAGRLGSMVLPPILRARNRAARSSTTCAKVEELSDEADALWAQARGAYPALGVRSTAAFPWRSPRKGQGLQRFELRRDGLQIGWFVLQVVDLREVRDSPFGPLTIGVVHDCLALPSDASTVCAWIMEFLLQAGVDLAIANHSHPAWHAALRRAGFLNGPNSFAFYRAPALSKTFAAHGVSPTDLYLTRSDDGLFTY